MTPDVEAALAVLSQSADSAEIDALTGAFADLAKAPARFVKKLKALTDSWPTPRAALGRDALDLGASLLAPRDREKAGRLFSLARRLERSAKLAIDPPALVASASAMARVGALDPRDLSRLMKELAADSSGALALVQAHLAGGGAPPDTVLRDVDALLKKGGVPPKDRAKQVDALLNTLLRSRSLRLASAKFWAANRAQIAAEVRGQPELQDALLKATPQIHPLGYGGTFDPAFAATWRALLTEAGCIEALAAGSLETTAADFVELACTRVGVVHGSAILVEWLHALAAALRSRPLRLWIDDKGAQSFDPDVLDAAIALDLPLVGPEDLVHPYLHLGEWKGRRAKGEPVRPLTGLVDHPQFGELFESMFVKSVEDHFQGDAFAAASLSVEGFKPLWQRRLVRYAAALTEGTVLSLEHATQDLGAIIGPELFRAAPEMAEIVGRVDLAVLLARTFSEGLVDEWGWPALDEAHRRLPNAKPFNNDGFTPYLTVYEPDRFVVCGIDGILHDSPIALPEGVQQPRRVFWIDGQALIVYHHGSLLVARWGAGTDGETWKTGYLHMGRTGLELPDGRVTAGGRAFRAGDQTWDDEGGLLTDGTGFWRVRGVQGNRRIESFDPETGQATADPLHPWLAEGDPAALAEIRLLPAWGPHQTPVGAPGAPIGFRAGNGFAERLDGKRWERDMPLRALMTFPGGSGLHAVHHDNPRNTTLIRTADGLHPLGHALYPGPYAKGSLQLLGMEWWGAYRPRDEAGSLALRQCTREQAAALLQAAVAGSGMEEAVRQVFPAVSHPNLIAGIAGVAAHAAHLDGVIGEWRSSLDDLIHTEPVAPEDDIDDAEAPILRAIFPRGAAFFGTFHLGRQLRETERFFFEDAVGDGESRPVSKSAIAWEALLDNAAPICWIAASSVALDEVDRAALVRVLSLWARSRFSEPGVRQRLRRSSGRAVEYPVIGMDWRSSQRVCASAGHRYLVRVIDASVAKDRGFGVLELRAEDADFADLAGVPAQWTGTAGSWGSSDQIQALLTVLEREGPFPVDPSIGERIAAGTGLLPASALQLWTGGMRGKAPGLTQDDLKLAGLELHVDLDAIYREAMPTDPAALWQPLEADQSGKSPVDGLIAAWNAHVARRPTVDRDVLLRAFDDFGDGHRHDLRLRQILDPDSVSTFTRDTSWAIRPYDGFRNNISYMQGHVPPGWPQPTGPDAFSGPVLRTMARYLPWLYQELPLGSPLHAAVVRWACHIDARLSNPDLLMLAGAVDLSKQEEPARLAEAFAALRGRFQGESYSSPDGEPVAPGIDRGDLVVTWPKDLPNGIFVAFRPAALSDAASLRQLSGELGFGEAFERHGGMCTCGLRFGQWDPLDITELDEFLAWRSPGFAAIRQRLAQTADFDPAAPQYDADPRVSAPDAVAATAAEHGLSSDSAALYLQLRTLSRPSRDHVRRYNSWSLAQYREALAPLVERGMVVERKVAATGRDWFLDEEIVQFPTRSSPMEVSKLALYGIEADSRGRRIPPFGMVLPCRPLGELFRGLV